jgi:hypothetical protein
MASNTEKKPTRFADKLVSFRTGHSIIKFVDDAAVQENRSPAAQSRHIYNAGLKALYGVEIRGNEIVEKVSHAS